MLQPLVSVLICRCFHFLRLLSILPRFSTKFFFVCFIVTNTMVISLLRSLSLVFAPRADETEEGGPRIS